MSDIYEACMEVRVFKCNVKHAHLYVHTYWYMHSYVCTRVAFGFHAVPAIQLRQ